MKLKYSLKKIVNEERRQISKIEHQLNFEGKSIENLDSIIQDKKKFFWDLLLKVSQGYNYFECITLGLSDQISYDLGIKSQIVKGTGIDPFVLIYLGLYKAKNEKNTKGTGSKIKKAKPKLFYNTLSLVSRIYGLSRDRKLEYGIEYIRYNLDRFLFERRERSLNYSTKNRLHYSERFLKNTKILEKYIIESKIFDDPKNIATIFYLIPLILEGVESGIVRTFKDYINFNHHKLIIYEEPMFLRKNLSKLAEQTENFPGKELRISKTISDFVKKCINLGKLPTEDVYQFLFSKENIYGIIIKNKDRSFILTSTSLIGDKWHQLEARIYDTREGTTNYVLNEKEKRNLKEFRKNIEKMAWDDLIGTNILPKGYWEYNIKENTFHNKRQIDFLGVFNFQGKNYIAVGDIKSITSGATFQDHFKKYKYKLKKGCLQVRESKEDIILNFELFKNIFTRKSELFNSISPNDIIKIIYNVPADLYLPTDPDVVVITQDMTKEQFLKQISFAVNQKYQSITDDLIHIFNWQNNQWVDIYSSDKILDLYDSMKVRIDSEISEETAINLKENNFKVFKR
jgi:hypothetical protein